MERKFIFSAINERTPAVREFIAVGTSSNEARRTPAQPPQPITSMITFERTNTPRSIINEPISAHAFPSLTTLHHNRAYPRELKAVFGLSNTDIFRPLEIVTQGRFSPPLNGKPHYLDVTWFGFRETDPARRKRLPDFFACELTNAQGVRQDGSRALIDLYEIAAIGNLFDVDILLTDGQGRISSDGAGNSRGLFQSIAGGATVKPRLTPLGFYEAPPALWNRITGSCANQVKLDFANGTDPAPTPCILWVVSYRHSGGRRPTTLKYATAAIPAGAVPHQDDDGSASDPRPGGE